MARAGGIGSLLEAALASRKGKRRPRSITAIEVEKAPVTPEDDMDDDGLEYGQESPDTSEEDGMGYGDDQDTDTEEASSDEDMGDPELTPERLRCAEDAFQAIERGDRRGFVEAILAIAGS